MYILITGGTGLIGQNLVKQLHEKNHNLVVLTRNKQKARHVLSDNISLINSLNEIDFNTLDVVINLAGENIAEKRWSKEQKHQICQSRWELTQKLTKKIKMADSPPSCFISGSAIGYYGRQNSEKVTENTHTVHNEFTHEICNKWEHLALTSKKYTRVCILRTGIVLDKNHGALKKMLLPFKLGLGGKVANGKQYMSWIHITDMVNAIMYLIDNTNSEGVYNITSPNAVNNDTFTKTLCKTIHRPYLFPIPAFILKTLLGEMSDLLLYGQNVYPEKLIKENFKFKYNTLSDALNNLLID